MGTNASSESSAASSSTSALTPKFKLSGKFSHSWTLPKVIENLPNSLTHDEQNIYICDTSIKCIYLYSFEGKLNSIWTPPPKAGEWDPKAIEIEKDLFFILHHYSMMVLDRNKNQVLYKWNIPDGFDGSEGHYFKVYYGESEKKQVAHPIIYMTLDNSHVIYVYNIKGELLKQFGEQKKSKKNGKFNYPRGLAVDNKYLYVCDSSNHRLQVLDKEDGKFIRSFGIYGKEKEGEFCFPTGLLLVEGLLYISDYYRIQVFTTEGVFVQYMGKGSGTWGSNSGEFSDPRGLTMANKKLYVADKDNHRIQAFS